MWSSSLRSGRGTYLIIHSIMRHGTINNQGLPDKNANSDKFCPLIRKDQLLRDPVNEDAEEFMNFKCTLCRSLSRRNSINSIASNEKI